MQYSKKYLNKTSEKKLKFFCTKKDTFIKYLINYS